MCLINEAWKNKAKQFLPKLNLTKCNLLFFMKNTRINNFVKTIDRHSLIDSKARANHIVLHRFIKKNLKFDLSLVLVHENCVLFFMKKPYRYIYHMVIY